MTSIENYTFRGCRNLTSIQLPEGVTSIGESAFYGCNSLTSINIPDSVTSIGQKVFQGCSALESVEFKNPTGWWVSTSSSATSGEGVTLTDVAQNATYLKTTYCDYFWKKSA